MYQRLDQCLSNTRIHSEFSRTVITPIRNAFESDVVRNRSDSKYLCALRSTLGYVVRKVIKKIINNKR
jgi:hypothetical protein